MAFRFNEEQTAILDQLHYRDSQILAVNALAGTGKTTTLKGAAQYPLKAERLRYFVFNRRNADEAAAEFPNNTTTSTAHSFAFRAPHPDGGGSMAEVYGASTPRLFSGSLYGPLRDQMKQSTEFADRIRQIRQELRCSEGRAIMAVQSVLRQYCQSADEQIGPQHIAPDLAEYIHRQGLRGSPKATLGTATWAWDRMRDPFSQFPIDHGVYLKLCSLAPPRIPADTILFDEAQDASPPMLAILKAQLQYGTRLVLVGDTYQHIYDFTGAVDAMEVMRKDHPDLTQTLPLATSYRFGQDVADAGNHFLRLMGSPYLLVGKGPDSRVEDDRVGNVHAVLFRGNAGLLQAAVQAVVAGQRIHVVGGTGEIVNLVEAMGRMYKGEFAKHPELSFFDDWHQLAEYAQTPLGSNFAPLVKIVEQKQGHVEDIARALRNTETDPARAQYVLSTGHKSKGGQWNNVLLMDDFQRSWLNADPEGERQYQVPGDDALCLQYVACTRAQTTLYTNGLLGTMERALREEQDAATKDLRDRIPEVLAGIEAWRNPPQAPDHPLAGCQPLAGCEPLGITDPAALAALQKIEASPYGLSWLLGDEAARDSGKDPEFTDDPEWKSARKQFAAEIEMILSARMARIGQVLMDHGWEASEGGYRRGEATISLKAESFGIEAQIGPDHMVHRDVLRIPTEPMAAKLHDLSQRGPVPLHPLVIGPLDDPGAGKDTVADAGNAAPIRDKALRLFALAESPNGAQVGAFIDGPSGDVAGLIAFGDDMSFLVELYPDKAPVILGQLTDKSREGFLRTFCKSDDLLANIGPSEERQEAQPQFAYGRRP